LSDAARTKLRRHKIGSSQRFICSYPDGKGQHRHRAVHIMATALTPHRFDVVTQMLGLAGRFTISSEFPAASSSA